MLESWETREEGTHGVKLDQLALSLHQVCQELMCVCDMFIKSSRIYPCIYMYIHVHLRLIRSICVNSASGVSRVDAA